VYVKALRRYLAEPKLALASAVADGVRAHVAALRSRGIKFYGYALHPGEPYDIHSVGAVTNSEQNIAVQKTDVMYRYFRYCVDEWANWDLGEFAAVNALLVECNERFRSMHSKCAGDCWMDEFELAHSNALLNAVLRGLEAARDGGSFGDIEPFLAVWISDSDHEIMFESVRRLNSAAIVREFMREFA
jgi:hypothetical protein